MESKDMKMRIVVLEDEPLYRELLETTLGHHPRLEVVAAYDEAAACIEGALALRPDAALCDIELHGSMSGIEVALRLKERMPELGTVFLTHHVTLAHAISLQSKGIEGWGYLLKSSVRTIDALVRAVEGAASGLVVIDPQLLTAAKPRPGSPLEALTQRQLDVLRLMAEGYHNKAIAQKLGITIKTTEHHVNAVYAALVPESSSQSHPRVRAVLEYLHYTRIAQYSDAGVSSTSGLLG